MTKEILLKFPFMVNSASGKFWIHSPNEIEPEYILKLSDVLIDKTPQDNRALIEKLNLRIAHDDGFIKPIAEKLDTKLHALKEENTKLKKVVKCAKGLRFWMDRLEPTILQQEKVDALVFDNALKELESKNETT